MTTLPPIPEPGAQSADDRRAIARRYILQSRRYLEQGDRLQAGEKAWGAVAQSLKTIAELRGWPHNSHQLIENTAYQMVTEFLTLYPDLGQAISDVYHNGHRNFYENQTSFALMRQTVQSAEEALAVLETLQRVQPRPFTITSNRQLHRLRALTENDNLQIGDSSPVGFSRKHAPDGANNNAAPTE